VLLFAYGSAMAESEIQAVAPGASFAGRARLDGYALAFRRRSRRWGGGAADIVPSEGEAVWGAVYELPAGTLDILDAREGEGFAYRRLPVELELDGARVAAETYEVIHKEPADLPPSAAYTEAMLAGARERGLPDDYVEELERRLSGLAGSGTEA
jgi:gamma-glutamylcyclotransferase (GGCT)/AIG2-like uncharacterized protein YtfP